MFTLGSSNRNSYCSHFNDIQWPTFNDFNFFPKKTIKLNSITTQARRRILFLKRTTDFGENFSSRNQVKPQHRVKKRIKYDFSLFVVLVICSSDTVNISGRKYDYSTFDLGSLIMTVIKKNIFFVKLNEKFNELTTHDQKLILQKNMSEMCHIRGAIRFDTKSKNFVWYFSKKDQLQMAFEKKKPDAGSSSSSASSSSSSSSSSSAKNARLSNALIGQQDMSKFYKSTTR